MVLAPIPPARGNVGDRHEWRKVHSRADSHRVGFPHTRVKPTRWESTRGWGKPRSGAKPAPTRITSAQRMKSNVGAVTGDRHGWRKVEQRRSSCRRPPWMAEGRATQEQLPGWGWLFASGSEISVRGCSTCFVPIATTPPLRGTHPLSVILNRPAAPQSESKTK